MTRRTTPDRLIHALSFRPVSCQANASDVRIVDVADRIEREIEDILRKVDDLGSYRKNRKKPPRQPPSRPSRPTANSLNPQLVSWLIVAGIIAAAVFLERSVNANGLMLALVIVGLIALGTYLLRQIGTQSKPQSEKRWRGQTLDLRQNHSKRTFPWGWFRHK